MDEIEKLVITQLALPIVKDILLPKIKLTFEKYFSKDHAPKDYEGNFEYYLQKKYEKFFIIDTLVFPNKQTLFKILYEPLTIVQEIGQKKIEEKIDKYPKDFISNYYRIIIEDTAGMGKSTIIRKIFLSIIEEKAGFPFLIELRQINSNNTILNEIKNQISVLEKNISEDFIVKLLEQGDFLFLFDGFDEIALKDREFVIKELKQFVNDNADNYFIMTSRPDDSLASFGDFQKFHIKPLFEKEAFDLIKRYDFYSYHPIAEDLIKQLSNQQQKTLEDYLTNPFLVSLLYKSYEYKKDIPLKKSQFYRQVFDALFEAHDLSKEGYLKRDKYSNLHTDDFERVLRAIGYFTAIENKVEYEKDYIINKIDNAKELLPDLNFKSSDFLKDLLETVPLFKKDGNYYKWSHKSLQDYFGAKFIWIDSKKLNSSILEKIYKSEDNRRFYNLLDIYYELDPTGFEYSILYKLLADFKQYSGSSFKEIKNINKSELKTRIQNSYNKQCSIVKVSQKNLDENEELVHNVFQLYQIPFKAHYIYSPVMKESRNRFLIYYGFGTNIQTILGLVSERYPGLSFNGHWEFDANDETDLDKLDYDVVYTFNEDPQFMLNNKMLFGIGNKLLSDGMTINYDISTELFEKIEIQMKKNVQNKLLQW